MRVRRWRKNSGSNDLRSLGEELRLNLKTRGWERVEIGDMFLGSTRPEEDDEGKGSMEEEEEEKHFIKDLIY